MAKWFIDTKPKDYIDGKEVLRISIGGNEDSGYYIVYRGQAKKIARLLEQANKNFKQVLKDVGVDV